MRVLLSSIACHPEHGSEAAVGWKAALALSKKHNVHVLTSESNRASIERFFGANGLHNLAFTFFGADRPYCQNRFVARAQSWLRYTAWTKESLFRAEELAARNQFDVVHQVTFSTCRVASPLWRLGLPTVVGPVGGGESTPWACLGSMSGPQRIYEIGRAAANAAMPFSPKLRQAAEKTNVFIASNQPTRRMLLQLGARAGHILELPVVFFTDEQLARIMPGQSKKRRERKGLKLFASGILEGRKGIGLVLKAMRIAKTKGLLCEFTIPSQGPEFHHLRRLASELGLGEAVKFPDTLSREDYWNELRSADIYAMPSLRDNCPATLLEAMLSGCAPIVADCNGPGEVVPPGAGIKIPPMAPGPMAEAIAIELLSLDADRPRLRQLGEAAENHVRTAFTEKHYLETIESAYASAIQSG
jgi:glycosyltransferase involved in cell wall biosynthesis